MLRYVSLLCLNRVKTFHILLIVHADITISKVHIHRNDYPADNLYKVEFDEKSNVS